MNATDDRAKSIFLSAAEIAAPEDRRAFIDLECAGDESLRSEVGELLCHQQALGSFLETPPAGLDATVDRPLSERPGTAIGPYKLLQQIGEGGMGVVFMAEQTQPIQRTVALKIIKPGMDSRQVIARFEAERQALALMDHPNIAKVLDAGTTDSGRPYFVMELVKGVPITQYCDDKHLPLRARLELLVPVCQAVQHAHQKGLIHRDIKPTNVLVAEYDDLPVPKVIDFGVAKATAQKLTERTMFTEFGQVIGTLEYMSPEQAKLNQFDVDTRSDIYSLGVLLYELLTGSTPFGRKRLQEAAFDEMLRIIREEEPPKPSTRLSTAEGLPAIAANRGSEPKKLNGLVKGELDWVVMKALEKNRNMRYETAIGLALDLQRYLEGEPVLAHPPSATYRLRKFLSKNRGPALTAGVVFLALLGGVAGTTLGMIRAGRAERHALGERDAAVNARKEAFEVLTDLTDSTVGALLVQNSSSSPVQRPFLERVVARYGRLARDLGDSAEAKAMSARCVEQVGRTYLLLGDSERAVTSLSQASDLLRNLHIDAPNDPDLTRRLIDCLNYLAIASHRMQRSSDFNRLEEEALQIAIAAHQQFPKHIGLSQSLAVLYSNRASRRWADTKARLVDVNESIEVARELVAIDSSDPKNLRALAIGLSQAVNHYSSLNDVDQARSALEEVQGLISGIDLDGNSILAECYESYGGALDRTTQQEAAIAAYRVAADFYELQAAQSPGDANNAAHAASCYDSLEKLLRRSGRQVDADGYLRRALALAEKSVNRSGGEAASMGNYIDLTAATARSHFAAGRHDEGMTTLDRLIAAGHRLINARPVPLEAGNQIDREDARRQAHRFRQLADLSNQGNRWQDTIAFAHKELEFARLSAKPGEGPTEELFTLMESGNWSLVLAYDALGKLREARPFWEELIRQTAWETPARIHEGACRYIGEIADKFVASGESADPAMVLASGIAERNALIAKDPTDVAARSDLWRGYQALGGIQETRKHFQEAFEANEQGIAITPLLDAHLPAMTQADRDTYALLLYGRAVCGDALGHEAEAEAAWAAARKFSGTQYDQFTFEKRAITMARNGQGEWAVQLAEQVVANPGGGGARQYNAACIYSLASADQDLSAARGEELARRAVGLLVESKNEGFFDSPVEVANAKADNDLDPLRQRDDFRRALPEVATGAPTDDNASRPPARAQKETDNPK